MRIVILGASISGMLAAARFPDAVVLEAAGKDQTARVMDATFYAHKQVPHFAEQPLKVYTTIRGGITNYDPRAYALKVYGDRSLPVSLDDIKLIGRQDMWEWDGRALFDALDGRTSWGCKVVSIDRITRTVHYQNAYCATGSVVYDVLLSSLPMPVMLKMLGPDIGGIPQFRSQPIWLKFAPSESVHHNLPPGVIEVEYCPQPMPLWYRLNRKGGRIEMEYTDSAVQGMTDVERASLVALRPGKIWPNSEAEHVVRWTNRHDIYPIGRYALWQQKWLSHQTWGQLEALAAVLGQ